MKRRFRIYYEKELSKWFLTMNGYEIQGFKSWHETMEYLIRHWYCACLMKDEFGFE